MHERIHARPRYVFMHCRIVPHRKPRRRVPPFFPACFEEVRCGVAGAVCFWKTRNIEFFIEQFDDLVTIGMRF